MLTEKDLEQIRLQGLSPEEAEHQLFQFSEGFPFLRLVSPATRNQGILVLEESEVTDLAAWYDGNSKKIKITKFIPASGAASRMFKGLFSFLEWYHGTPEDISRLENDPGEEENRQFLANLSRFSFYPALSSCLQQQGNSLQDCLVEKQYHVIVAGLILDTGLGYGSLPKALLSFHHDEKGVRTPIMEHIAEGLAYCCDDAGQTHLHFTLSPEHQHLFIEHMKEVVPGYGLSANQAFDITFSQQKPSTDTLAVDLENHPFRDEQGRLVFRPGGHGALIQNLNDLSQEVIFIKNIDNVVPPRLAAPTYLYKKALGGLLLQKRQACFHYLTLMEQALTHDVLDEIADFAMTSLNIQHAESLKTLSLSKRQAALFDSLNRPIRVCGMVRNEGEPGGGPFWAETQGKGVSLQIIESSQVDLADADQQAIFSGATHFNPVDLVCSVYDYRGNRFNLEDFIDPMTGFISRKSKDGKPLKALERPGLWNGAMAGWITIFVEVPLSTFNPVKVINDLLRDSHQG